MNDAIGQLIQSPDPLALQRALEERDRLMQRQYGSEQMAGANYGAAGWAGVIGNLIGGLMTRRNRKKSGEATSNMYKEQSKYNSALEAFKAQEEQRKQQSQRALKLEDEARKRGYAVEDRNYNTEQQAINVQQSQGFQSEQNALNRNAVNNRFDKSFNQSEQQFKARQEQLGGQLTPIQKKLIPLVQSGQMSEDEANKLMLDDARGTKKREPSDMIKSRLSMIRNAKEKLAKYKSEAFVDGDYQELGSKFGNTNNLLVETVRNKLRAESGAAISRDEAENEAELFSPSMFRSDKTNLDKILELERTLENFERELSGGLEDDDKQPSKQEQLTPEQMKATLLKY